jgi:4-hydroxy-3-polyprenylbenzoate decarboxylase
MAITGASGAPYARALLKALLQSNLQVHLLVSQSAVTVMREEMNLTFPGNQFDPAAYLNADIPKDSIVMYDERDLAAGPSSGSFRHRGMIVCPCSMKTLATIAHGTGGSLITRAADACLKERRKLVLVPRETPLNLIHLKNMVTVTEAGAIVLPAMPGFYKQPQGLDDIIDHLVLKMLDSLGIEADSRLRWKDSGTT